MKHLLVREVAEIRRFLYLLHRRMAMGGHGLPKVSPGPAMPDPAGGLPLKRPNSHFRGGPPVGQVTCSCLLPLWTPHAIHLWL